MFYLAWRRLPSGDSFGPPKEKTLIEKAYSKCDMERAKVE
jgi:hypothetical protein